MPSGNNVKSKRIVRDPWAQPIPAAHNTGIIKSKIAQIPMPAGQGVHSYLCVKAASGDHKNYRLS